MPGSGGSTKAARSVLLQGPDVLQHDHDLKGHFENSTNQFEILGNEKHRLNGSSGQGLAPVTILQYPKAGFDTACRQPRSTSG
jgi:hypothetical protein